MPVEPVMHGKVAVVTGAAQGIGAAIATLFAARGARVLVADRDAAAGRRRAALLKRKGLSALFVKADVSRPADVSRMVKAAARAWGRVDLLLNNAGVGSGTSFLKRPLREWDRVINTNLRGAYLAAQAAAPHLIRAKGAIVNIASTRALMSEPGTEPYSSSKGGLLALTHALALSLAGRVRVNAVSPGWIDTQEWRFGARPRAWSRRDHAQHPAGRVGKPEDVAHACLFLCSREAGFITGQNLVVDGGMTVKMIYAE